MESGIELASQIGAEIDTAERAYNFDVQAVGTTQTAVEGMQLVVPPQSRPYYVRSHIRVQFVTGTAAAASLHQVNVILCDYTSGTSVNVDYAPASALQVSAATKTIWVPVAMERRFEANSVTKYYRIETRLQSAAVSGWTSTLLLADNTPDSGVYPPMMMTAVGC